MDSTLVFMGIATTLSNESKFQPDTTKLAAAENLRANLKTRSAVRHFKTIVQNHCIATNSLETSKLHV